MARELITSWGDYQTAIDRILTMATDHIFIYDEDLSLLKLDSAVRLSEIKRVTLAGQTGCLKIVVRNDQPMARNNPLLLNLLTTYSHKTQSRISPPDLAHLRDRMILVDGKHGLIGFEQEQARSKFLTDEAEELRPYYQRFQEIGHASGEITGTSVLGL